MELRPEEITKIIRNQIKNYENKLQTSETGTVILTGDGIAKVSGLEKCMAGELVEFPNGAYGMAQNLEEDTVSIVVLGDDNGIKEGDTVKRTGKVVSVPVGAEMIGRVVNALGQPIDGKGPVGAEAYRPIESPAPGIIDREPVRVPLQTGIKAIDSNCQFGVSPFGIRLNSDAGTGGQQSYHTIYCDAVAWMSGGYVDFIAPQLYWSCSNAVAPYKPLADWWATTAKSYGVDFYPALAAYRYDATQVTSDVFTKGEIIRQVEYGRGLAGFGGFSLFRYYYLFKNGVDDEINDLFT